MPVRGMDPGKLLDLLGEPGEMPAIAGWEFVDVAGEGGFGIVWKVMSVPDRVEAALKIASPSEPETIERIEGEAEALRALRHPNIVSLLDTGVIEAGDLEGGLFLAMEFIAGPSLDHEIPASGLEPDRAFEWFDHIVQAIIHAHDRGILHRDLKPSNIHLTAEGMPKVADFGLARPVHQRVHHLSLTRAGVVAGTAEYLPPEAYLENYRPAEATDIFALGVILHEMLSGTPPRGAWKPVSSNGRIDIRVDEVIRRALDPDPSRRWPSVEAMRAALLKILASEPHYAGRPKLTTPIRMVDASWTVLGLLTFCAGLSSLLHLSKARFDLPLDLIEGHGRLVGGFQAMLLLLVAGAFLGGWQLLRLRRFRGVPIREALPAPFGLSLGVSRAAAVVVAAFQMLCLFLPITHIFQLYLDCGMVWLDQESPPWTGGLSVVSWDELRIVSPWSTPDWNEKYWLYESMGPVGKPLSTEIDRLQFFPFYVPLVMVIGACVMVGSALTTLWVAISRWWRSRRPGRASILGILWVTVIAVLIQGFRAEDQRIEAAHLLGSDHPHALRRMTGPVRGLVKLLLSPSPNHRPPPLTNEHVSLYADRVDYRSRGEIGREVISQLPAAVGIGMWERPGIQITTNWDPSTDRFGATGIQVEFQRFEKGGGWAATLLTLKLSGAFDDGGQPRIERETLERRPLYEADDHVLSEADALAWVDGLSRLAAGGGNYDEVFHPCDLRAASAADGGADSAARRRAVADIRRAGAIDPDGMELAGELAGGRHCLTFPTEHLVWYAELIYTHSAWKCVSLGVR